MASKKYKNKACAYCAQSDLPTEREHVLAREFVLEGTPVKEWPCAPACRMCNGEKAHLERYVTAAGSMAGRHRDARENLEKNGERRLAKNPAIAQGLNLRRGTDWVLEGGLWVRAVEVDFDWDQLERLCGLIARGLIWHHWKVVLGTDCFVEVHRPLVGTRRRVFEGFRRMRGTRLTGAIGGDTFTYLGAQGTDNPQVTVWELKIFGGLLCAGDPDGLIGVMTGPKRVRDRAELRSRWLKGTRLHSSV
jgi:hypothetical protein